jgi:hypothetical protein
MLTLFNNRKNIKAVFFFCIPDILLQEMVLQPIVMWQPMGMILTMALQ